MPSRSSSSTFPGPPIVAEIAAGTRFVRIYDANFYADGARLRYFGPVRAGRFDHHPAGPAARHRGHGVIYVASTLACAVAEAYGDDRWVEPTQSQRLAVVELRRAVRVVETSGRAAVALGVPAGALRCRDRALTQRVARELHEGTDAEGVAYDGWFTGERCVAVWERAADVLDLVDDRAMSDPWVCDAVEVAADELLYARP